jgi:hypothetical protein
MSSIQDDEVIQAFSSNRANQYVNAVSISDEIPAWVSIGEGLYDLLHGPGRSGMLGDIEMQNFGPTMIQDEKDQQYRQGDGRHSQEIQRHHLAKMVAQEGVGDEFIKSLCDRRPIQPATGYRGASPTLRTGFPPAVRWCNAM